MLLTYKLLQDIKYSSLCYAVGTLLLIYFICSIYISIPKFSFIPLSLSPWVTVGLSFESLFLFCK